MSAATPSSAWIYLVAAVLFLLVGVRDLGVGNDPNWDAAWELTFAVANGLLFWYYRSGPAWTKTVGTVLFVVGIAGALASIFFDSAA